MFRPIFRAAAALISIFPLIVLTACTASGTPKQSPNPAVDQPLAATKGRQEVVFAGGCFWGIQAVFEHVKGVTTATAGYSGGEANTAEYETISTGTTGHAESVKVVFDPSQVTFGQLLKVFFLVAHDPTELNRQGPDTGTQYRSVIFFTSADQQHIAALLFPCLRLAHAPQQGAHR